MNQKEEYPLQFIKGVGPKRAKLLEKIGLKSYLDVVNYYPISYIERNSSASIKELVSYLLKQSYILEKDYDSLKDLNIRKEFTVIGKIINKRELTISRGRKLLTIMISDGSSTTARINFWNYTDFFKQKYTLGLHLAVSGNAKLNKSYPEFTHPDIDIISEKELENYNNGYILPRYRIPDNLKKSSIGLQLLRNIVDHSLKNEISRINDQLPEYILLKSNCLSKKETIKNLHFPESKDKLNKALQRMKFEEIFIYLLKMKLGKNVSEKKIKSIVINGKSLLSRKVYNELPYKLTNDQKKVLNDIAQDIDKQEPMNRLLQGDVGSGKTIVALLAMLMAVDKSYQALFIAPTEILAEQHFKNFEELTSHLNIKIGLLTGSLRSKAKKELIQSIADGEIDIIVGTHALFQANLQYKNLAFIVIDEQHRFGVAQRDNLKNLAKNSFSDRKNVSPHILVMSATPIPRTLSMTVYSDLEVSFLKEKPAGRSPIITTVSFESKLKDVWKYLKTEIKKGRQAYIVFPLVEKSEKLDLKAAEEQYSILSNSEFKEIRCGLLHGKMHWDEKNKAMEKFKNRKIQLLFSTTVIEVGIDVPNASLMVILNAERFGLSQLHQLRGRVGRGKYQSFCILVTADKYEIKIKRGLDKESEKISAVMRLKTMEETEDGFKIAEADLKIRGPGDMTGTKQSGLPDFKFLNLLEDSKIISKTKNLVEDILTEDPFLELEKNKKLKSWIEFENQKSRNYSETA